MYRQRELIVKNIINKKGDHNKYDCFLPKYALSEVPHEKRMKYAFERFSSIVDERIDPNDPEHILYLPKKFPVQMLNDEFAKNYQFKNNRWAYDGEFDNIIDKYKQVD